MVDELGLARMNFLPTVDIKQRSFQKDLNPFSLHYNIIQSTQNCPVAPFLNMAWLKLPYYDFILSALALFLLIPKAQARQSFLLNYRPKFPYHMYIYIAHRETNIRVSLRYHHYVPSCFQIWLFRLGSNLVAQPFHKSDTRCGNFTIDYSWSSYSQFYYQVKAIQLNQPKIRYTLSLYQYSIWDNSIYQSPGRTYEHIMLRQFPNLAVVQINPCIHLLGFQANKAYCTFTTYNETNLSAMFFWTGVDSMYCMEQKIYREVGTDSVTSCQVWFFVFNSTFVHISNIRTPGFNIEIIADSQMNGSEIVKWDHNQQQCIIQIPPPLPPEPAPTPVSPAQYQKVSEQQQLAPWKIALILVSILIPVIIGFAIVGVAKGWWVRRVVPQQRPAQRQAEESPICTICLGEDPNYVLIACAHTFHLICIKESLRIRPTCPNCRRQVDREQIAQLRRI